MAQTGSPVAGFPQFPTSFHGRQDAVTAAVTALSSGARILTMVGVGGVGKTRLATEVVARLDPSLQSASHFVSLAAVRQASLVLPTIANLLRVRPDEPDLLTAIGNQIGQRQVLLVLDNMEWLLGAVDDIRALLDRCSNIQVLATSRIPLGIRDEIVCDVEPLTVPEIATSADSAHIVDNAAVRLFIDRARVSGPDVQVKDDDLTAVAAICQRLDGIPLGIELAAARTSVLPPKAMLRRLKRRLALLESSDTTRPDRHRTMREAIGWSYDLLSPDDQALFRRLCVFDGGFSLASVEAMVAGWTPETGYPFAAGQRIYDHGWADSFGKEGPRPSDGEWSPPSLEALAINVYDSLHKLIAARLIRVVEPVGDEARYDMLETIREFGLEAVEHSPEADAIRHAHAARMLVVAEIAGWGIWGKDRSHWLTRLDAELGNIRAAYEWLATQPVPVNQLLLRMVDVLWAFWMTRGRIAEGRQYAEFAFARPGGSPMVRAVVASQVGYFSLLQGDDAHAKAILEENVIRSRSLDFPLAEGSSNLFLALVAWRAGDLEAMHNHLLLGIERSTVANDFISIGIALILLSILARGSGKFGEAASLLVDAQKSCEVVGFAWGVATCAYYTGELHRARGNGRLASRWLNTGLRLYHEQDDVVGMAGCLSGLATLAARFGDLERAARLFAAAGKLSEGASAFLPPSEIASYQAAAVLVQDQLDAETYYRAATTGYMMPREHLLAEAKLVTGKPLRMPMEFESNTVDQPGHGLDLTDPQREVLTLYARGLKVKEIADVLSKGGSTIYDMLRRIKDQYGIDSNGELIVFAREHGLR